MADALSYTWYGIQMTQRYCLLDLKRSSDCPRIYSKHLQLTVRHFFQWRRKYSAITFNQVNMVSWNLLWTVLHSLRDLWTWTRTARELRRMRDFEQCVIIEICVIIFFLCFSVVLNSFAIAVSCIWQLMNSSFSFIWQLMNSSF